MPRQSPQGKIEKAILDGICNAERTYEKWSGGEILAYTAEHVLYGFIAKAIMKIPGTKYVEIESRCKAAIKAAGGNRRGKLPQAARPGGHIDILVWWAGNTPRAIIEVKHNVYNYSEICDADIRRITSILKKNATLQFGMFAFYSSARPSKEMTAKQRLEERFDKIIKRIDYEQRDKFKVTGDTRIVKYRDLDKTFSAWSASYILMKPY